MTAVVPSTRVQVVVVASSPRSLAGCLTWPAWQALQAGTVLHAGSPHLPALAAAGVVLEQVVPDAAALLDRALADGGITWLAGADRALLDQLDRRATRTPGVELQVVHGSPDVPGSRLLDVVAVMDRLRSPGGCPWDAEQTHTSLMPYLLEEAYEAYEALEIGDDRGLREELGDVLLQVVFHARIAASWDIDDVAGDLVDKLVRRHPHVFAGADATDLEGSWEALKRVEKGRTSVTDGVPMGQPALSLARTLQSRGSRLGAPVPSYDGIGGQLWALVARARQEGVDPEQALRVVARAYRDRLAGLEQQGLSGTALQGEQQWS